jgi:hypothetical protein
MEGEGPRMNYQVELTIKISMDDAAFEESHTELERILGKVNGKVARLLDRAEGCLCDADEGDMTIDDKLLDSNGNTVGRVRLSR